MRLDYEDKKIRREFCRLRDSLDIPTTIWTWHCIVSIIYKDLEIIGLNIWKP